MPERSAGLPSRPEVSAQRAWARGWTSIVSLSSVIGLPAGASVNTPDRSVPSRLRKIELGADEDRAGEIGAGEIAAAQIGIFEIGARELGAAQIGPRQPAIAHDRIGEVGLHRDRAR